jgi:hypothetical protein
MFEVLKRAYGVLKIQQSLTDEYAGSRTAWTLSRGTKLFHLADTKNQFAIAAKWVANTASISNIIGMMALRRAKNFSNAVRREVCIDSVNS